MGDLITAPVQSQRLIVPPQLEGLERFHRDMLDKIFGPSPPRPAVARTRRYLFLCFTNRCGSNYLAHLLASTGLLNEAGEFFNGATVGAHARAEGLTSLADYVNFLGRHLEVNEWLVSKLGIEQLVMLTEAGILDQIRDRTEFILIERKDHVAQAVSRLVAAQNLQWTSLQGARVPDDKLVYSRAGIDVHLQSVVAQNHMFMRFFATNGIVPTHLAYEALLAAPQSYLTSIGTTLGFDTFDVQPDRIGIEAQTSPLKIAWRGLYRAGA